MLIRKDMISHLKVRLIKKTSVNTFLKPMNFLGETLMLKLIYLIMQQKQN